MLPLLTCLRRRFLMRYLRFQLLILRRQIRILLRQRVHSPRQIRILLLQIRQLPLKLLILLPRLRILASRQRKSQTHRQQQNRCSVFPHSFSLSLGDWLRERPSVVAPSAPRHKPYPAPSVGAQHAARPMSAQSPRLERDRVPHPQFLEGAGLDSTPSTSHPVATIVFHIAGFKLNATHPSASVL